MNVGDVVGPLFLALMLVVPAAASHAFFVQGRSFGVARFLSWFVVRVVIRGVAWFVVRVVGIHPATRPDVVAPPAPSRPPPWTKAAERPPEPARGHRRAASAAESRDRPGGAQAPRQARARERGRGRGRLQRRPRAATAARARGAGPRRPRRPRRARVGEVRGERARATCSRGRAGDHAPAAARRVGGRRGPTRRCVRARECQKFGTLFGPCQREREALFGRCSGSVGWCEPNSYGPSRRTPPDFDLRP